MDEVDTSLNQALTEIAEIRGQMARTAEFRGYGPATILATAGLAGAAGVAQARWVPTPQQTPDAYAILWSIAAVAAAGLIAAETITRAKRIHHGLADEMILEAVKQFLPAAMAGLLLTGALLRAVPEDATLLPGLWQIIFSLGVFATCRILPRPMAAAGLWYLCTGLACIVYSTKLALSPWAMAAPYAVGQAMVAGILWYAFGRSGEKNADEEN